MLQGGAWCAHRSTKIIVRACHLDGEGLRTVLGAAGGPFAAAGSIFGEAVVSFVGKYLGTADCEVARNQPTLPFNSQQGPRVYYANKVLASLCPRRFSRWFSLSTVQRTVSRETAELHAAAQVSLAIPRHVRRTAHQKGSLWGFREVGVALIPLTCVTAPGSPRLSSLSV